MAEQARLKTGALGAAGITFLVVAAAAPLTVMTGVAPLAVSIGGIGAPVGYLLAGLVLTVFAVGFTAMTRHTRGAGAFYSYITLGLGRPLGAAAGLLAVLSYNALQIGVYGLLGVQFAGAWTRFTGTGAPWWIFTAIGIAGVWALGRRGIDVGAKVIGTLLIAETAILALLVAGVLTKGQLTAGTFTPSAVTSPGMLAILGFCFAAFMGFESTALYRGEARRPDRSIPRATYASVAFLGLFYCLVVWAIVQAFGDERVVEAAGTDPTGLFFTAMDTFVGAWASDLMYVLVLTSVLASQLAFHNAINRYAFSLAHDGLLPAAFGRTHPRFLSPAAAGAAQTILAAVVVAGFALAGADPYLQLLLLVNTPGAIGVVTLQALTSAAVLAYFLRRRGVSGSRVAIAAGGLALILLSVVLYLLIDNIALLTGAAFGANAALVAVVPAILAAGVAWAFKIKIKSPSSYGRIGGEEVRAMNPGPSAAVLDNENRHTEETHA
ncbi:APC family permease [Actinoplanes sichuanensis]|uniref:APC family permease n=1 Tax=Actinoplanes sichuanensis TaxID=512349 RepID=A0ABW4AB05_9ACTN|nr:APC family permease [Actinoplanes sichuanensis]BEL08663.1 APC family permease [Actinoplanes sichuanensis]